MIFLHKPYIKKYKHKSRLIFDIDIDGDNKSVWFEVASEYSKYLCDDRIDAILVGLLSYAMREGHNFESNSYVTDELFFKINEYLIPSLVKYGNNLKNISINIKCKKSISNALGVGTGCSCGVDSFHSILKHLNDNNSSFNITHLCINNVGAFNECYKNTGIDKVRQERIRKSKKLAKEIGLPIIVSDSNFYQEIPQNHLLTHTYSSIFAVLCMQKLWKIYYYGSSGLDFSYFNLNDNDIKDCAFYELLSLDCFSTSNLKIYSEGGALSRLEKTNDIYENNLVKKYLHVCTVKEDNCGVCPKCMRTILSLYALCNDLDEYTNVFDIDYFYQNKDKYFEWLYNEHQYKVVMNESIYESLLKKDDFRKYISIKEREKLFKNTDSVDENYYKNEYERLINSKTFKVGDAIMYIPRKIKAMLNFKNTK